MRYCCLHLYFICIFSEIVKRIKSNHRYTHNENEMRLDGYVNIELNEHIRTIFVLNMLQVFGKEWLRVIFVVVVVDAVVSSFYVFILLFTR